MYDEISKLTIKVPSVAPPSQSFPNDYQSIPDNILKNYKFEPLLEQNVINQHLQFLEYHQKLRDDSIKRQNKLMELKKQAELDYANELKRKAPGLSKEILEPTRTNSPVHRSPEATKASEPAIDFAEFIDSTHNSPQKLSLPQDINPEDDVYLQLSNFKFQSFDQNSAVEGKDQPKSSQNVTWPRQSQAPKTAYVRWPTTLQNTQPIVNPPPVPSKSLVGNREKYLQMGFNVNCVEYAIQNYSTEDKQLDIMFLINSYLLKGFDFESVKGALEFCQRKEQPIDKFFETVLHFREMGFGSEDAVSALIKSENNKDLALSCLLNE